MAIEFHCDHCGMMVRTSDEHAGKRGRCPGCKQSVYIPMPDEDIEVLELAPLDENGAPEQLDEHTRRLAHQIHADETGEGDDDTLMPEPDVVDHANIEELVIDYALAMADGRLDEAERLSTSIHKRMDEADDVIQRITSDDIPPRRLAKVPHAVLVGFLRQLQK